MKFIILLIAVAYVNAAAQACADNLDRKACADCTGNTHVFACGDTIATCLKCDNTEAACSTFCEGKNFISKEKTCISCGGITGCPHEAVSCSLKDGVVDPNSKKCKACALTHKKEEVSGKSDRCVPIEIAGCHAETQQDCTLDGTAGAKTCKANTKTCSKCAASYEREAGVSGTRDDRCVAVAAVAGCDTTTSRTCTLDGTAGSKTCKSGTTRCTKCQTGFLRYDGSVPTTKVDDKCVQCTALTGCKSGKTVCKLAANAANIDTSKSECTEADSNYVLGKDKKVFQVTGVASCNDATCTEDTTSANTCKTGSKLCEECGTGKFAVRKDGVDGTCQDDIPKCVLQQTSCTADAASACTAGTKKCGKCQDGYVKFVKDKTDDKCVSIGINDCQVGTCELETDGSACKANTATCSKCKTGFQLMKPANKNHVCADAKITSCSSSSCTEDDAKTACKANTKKCAKCSSGYSKVEETGKDDSCVACKSTTAACKPDCTMHFTKGDKCIAAWEASGLDLIHCTKAKAAGSNPYLTDKGMCRVGSTLNCPVGTCFKEVYHKDPKVASSCTRCNKYNSDRVDYANKPTKDAIADLTKCTACSATTCTAGSCSGGKTLASGKCSLSGGNATGNNTNSTGVRASLQAFSAIVFLLLAAF